MSYKFVNSILRYTNANLVVVFFVEVENESINRELEKQFNEGLQSQILHTHYEGLGFHSNECQPPSTSDNPHRQSFVRATTETRSVKK